MHIEIAGMGCRGYDTGGLVHSFVGEVDVAGVMGPPEVAGCKKQGSIDR